MTKHRKPHERIDEILDAASNEILDGGFVSLSMEGIARRVELSKGGIYRFFKNKDDVALALFTRCYEASLDFDVDASVALGLSIEETVFRAIYRFQVPEDTARKLDRIWLSLLPKVLEDQRFREARNAMLGKVKEKVRHLWEGLTARESLVLPADLDERLENALMLGIALLEGLTVQGFLGTPMAHQENLTRMFVASAVGDILDGATRIEDGAGSTLAGEPELLGREVTQ